MRIVGKITPFLGNWERSRVGLKFLNSNASDRWNHRSDQGIHGSDEGLIGNRLVDAVKGGFAQIIHNITFGLISYDTVTEFLDPLFEPVKNFFGNVGAIFNDPELSIFQKLGLIFEEYLFMMKESLRARSKNQRSILHCLRYDQRQLLYSGIANLISSAHKH